MSGALLNEMRQLNQKIITNGGYETDVTFKSDTDPAVEVVEPCNLTFHSTDIDSETGQEITGRQVHLLVNINSIVDKGYPVYRDDSLPEEPTFNGDVVTFVDALGKTNTMKVIDNRPDHTFGCITLFLGAFE